ncbi:M28 family peptidase [Roseimaritima sediminicola]|uniref:M28 family peptidase n=1 Tax=Roseimaritima sediminicola TaxID=2662066 RepID=UPI001386E912|nr:M28 family peptidase [Roseimaritima sediminicola]
MALAQPPAAEPERPAAQPATQTEPQSAAETSERPDSSRLRSDLRYLASDELTGRGPGTPGIDLAAKHIAGAFAEMGLETDAVPDGPFQRVELELQAKAGPAEENYVQIRTSGGTEERLELDAAMVPLSIGSPGKAQGPLVFVGYGIAAAELDYDDWADVDVEGAVVMLIRKTPGEGRPDHAFADRQRARHAFFTTKVQHAERRGAAAVLIVNDRGSIQSQVDRLKRRVEGEQQRIDNIDQTLANAPEGLDQVRKTLQETRKVAVAQLMTLQNQLEQAESGLLGVNDAGGFDQPATIPVVSISRTVADRLLRDATEQSLAALETAIAEDLRPRSRPLADVEIQLETSVTQARIETSNVIGILPGRGELKDETVVVGAHYDHVGMGGYGSLAPGTIAVHNGADDNASGTVVMMEVARRMVRRMEQYASHRRVVFIAFTGEERGLLGSKHYVREPLFPLAQTVAMVNLDMVGRLKDNELTVYGTGTADRFDDLLDRLNQTAGFRLLRVASGYGPSDHASFYQAKIPVLFFFTGLHNDYHRPSDDFDKIDFGGLARITDMVTDGTADLATGPRPNYRSTEPGAGITRQLTVFVGIRMRNGADSVTVSEVHDGSPAAQAGIQTGDVVQRIENRQIQNSDDILEALRGKQPGDRLPIHVLRNGQAQQIDVWLAPRP